MYFLKDKDLRLLFGVCEGVAAPYILFDLYNAALKSELAKEYNYKSDTIDFRGISNIDAVIDKFAKKTLDFKPDICFFYGIQPPFISILNDLKIYTCSFFFDDIYEEIKNHEAAANCFKLLKSKYSNVFTSDIEWQKKLKDKVEISAYFLRLATNDFFLRFNDIPKTYDYDISFIGTLTENRLDILSQIKKYNVHFFGRLGDLPQNIKLPNNFFLHQQIDYYTEAPKIYNKSKINICLTAEQLITGVSQRAFDIPAANGFLLHDYREDIFNIFGDSAIVFKTAQELNELIDFYMANESKRFDYIKYTNSIISSQHTYCQRFNEIIDVLENKYAYYN